MELNASTSAQQATTQIRNMILNGEFLPGDPVRQDILAARLGISRTPLRQALQSLHDDGLVVHSANKGARVALITPDLVRDLFDMRLALEPMAFRAALPILSKLDFARAEMALDSQTPESTPAELSDLNWAFHYALYAPCQRELLLQTLQRLNRTAALASTIGMSITTQPGTSHEEHCAILAACKNGDDEGALALMVAHLTGAKAALLRALESQ
ncbi:MAG: GntR family transcriptional regulator [Rhizobiales bacterium]|nr:GntR family transcriptional regulator [Hyphomicrobiales bacterium]